MNINTNLEGNWLHKDDGNCLALMRLYDTQGDWECLVYAQNPEDSQEIAVLLSHPEPFLSTTTWKELDSLQLIFSRLSWDNSFVPVRVNTYLRRLKNVFEGRI